MKTSAILTESMHNKFKNIKFRGAVILLQTSKQGKFCHQVGLKPTPLAVQAITLPFRPLTPPFSLGSYPRALLNRSDLSDLHLCSCHLQAD